MQDVTPDIRPDIRHVPVGHAEPPASDAATRGSDRSRVVPSE